MDKPARLFITFFLCLVHKCFGNNHPSQCVGVNLVPRSGNREGDVSRQCSRGFLTSLAASCLHLIDRQVSTITFMVPWTGVNELATTTGLVYTLQFLCVKPAEKPWTKPVKK